MYFQNHLAMLVSDDCCWVSGSIIEKPHYIVVGFSVNFDWVASRSLRATNIVESMARV